MEINADASGHRGPTSLVALGDSFTEGMSDLRPDGSYRGWADLLAARLAARSPGFRYANLAVRGKLLGQIVEAQVPPAAAMRPDVITFVGGLNDVLRPRIDMDRVRDLLERAVGTLAPNCGRLVLMHSPGRHGPLLDAGRPRMEELYAHLDLLAARHGAVVVDINGAPVLGDSRLWDADRLHLTAEGHRRGARARWPARGRPAPGARRAPPPPRAPPGRGARPPAAQPG
ncbi:SGNH/GDSL hydrolase family protein, partial [Streptomyces sp. NPDC058953]|uniref:SGNH/GDSL hydrolase family protein n=1 Tax=Streptomyces sp. NPDC058953 TaxID=3346676 RepID=UPI0036870E98